MGFKVVRGSFQGVSRMFDEVLGVFRETFKGDSKELLGIKKKFKGCF